MNFNNTNFICSINSIEHFPNARLPEVALVGKSNVGKSSLVNYLCNHGKLARVSKTPGATKTINIYDIDNKLLLVDLPGYGYSKVSNKISDKWQDLILDYLKFHEQLIYLLVDSRHGLKENDLLSLDLFIRLKKEFKIVFTKTDKISNAEKTSLIENTKKLLHGLPINCSELIFTSKYDIKELKSSILQNSHLLKKLN